MHTHHHIHHHIFGIYREYLGRYRKVNKSDEFVKNVVLGKFDYIQLHGSESKERVKKIKSMGIKVIKAIKIKTNSDIKEYKNYDDANIILFDTPGMEKSIQFPLDLISKLPKGERYALAGSISKNNIENIQKLGVELYKVAYGISPKIMRLVFPTRHEIKYPLENIFKTFNVRTVT